MDNTGTYKKLKVWQRSMGLVKDTYDICKKLPRAEDYALKSQMQRAAVSIPSNIAEGQERNSKKEFSQFIAIARGSAAELETQLMIVENLYTIPTEAARNETVELRRMLRKLSQTL